jgi:16S rRNA (cytosine967-C5)-methyltransferase
MIAALALIEGWSAERIGGAFDGVRYHPKPLSQSERALARSLERHTLEHPSQPDWVRLEVPEWLVEPLRESLGARFERELTALMGEAPVDLRVNTLKASRDEAIKALAAEGIEAGPTRYSPVGLRLAGRAAIAASKAFRDGLIEFQDEGSQLAALMTDARPGQRVCDFCAGAGGKTLALAATMVNRGSIVALDVREGRIARAGDRLRRAGVHNVTRRQLEGHRDPWVKRHKVSFARVLVDAPCTGCGTWRRNPDAKWQTRPKDLDELVRLQGEIIDSAARLVNASGRLVYVTCSLLRAENEAQAERFLAQHPDFHLLTAASVWAETVGGDCPASGEMLRLSPVSHGTDGFFIAIFERG